MFSLFNNIIYSNGDHKKTRLAKIFVSKTCYWSAHWEFTMVQKGLCNCRLTVKLPCVIQGVILSNKPSLDNHVFNIGYLFNQV